MNEFKSKINTYKIIGETEYLRQVSSLVGFLSEIKEINPTSIKTKVAYGVCKFKFKGTETQLRDLLFVISNKLEFKIKKVRKILF